MWDFVVGFFYLVQFLRFLHVVTGIHFLVLLLFHFLTCKSLDILELCVCGRVCVGGREEKEEKRGK